MSANPNDHLGGTADHSPIMDTEKRVRTVLSRQLGLSFEECHTGATIYLDMAMDSLDAIEVVMALEEEFRIEIPDDDLTPDWTDDILENKKTCADIITYIESRLRPS